MGLYIYIHNWNIPSLHKKFWLHQSQATVRKESLPPLKNNTRRSQQVGASGANLGLVPRDRMAGC